MPDARPARVLFTSWPFPGHLFPQIAVAHALRRKGHEVAFYTGSAGARIIRDEGFTCYVFDRVDEQAVDDLMRRRPAQPWRPTQMPRLGRLLRRWLLETTPDQIEDLEPIVSEWEPTVLVTEPTMWGPLLVVGEKHRLPVAVCSFVPAWMVPREGEPPFGPGLPPPRSAVDRLRARLLARVQRAVATVANRQANEIRRAHGLPPIDGSVTEHACRMPLYLVPSAPEFDYGRTDLPPGAEYVGPLLWNRPQMDSASTAWDRELDPSRPCIHVSEGTVHVQQPILLKAAVAGLADLPVQVVATTGGNRTAQDLGLGPLPANVRIDRWISHADLLPHVDVMVTTGGAGSVLASLSAGVPLVVVPTEWEKPEIAQRVVEAGAGVRLAPGRCSAEALRASVLEVLDQPRFREAARRLAEIFARQGGPDRAAALVGSLRAA